MHRKLKTIWNDIYVPAFQLMAKNPPRTSALVGGGLLCYFFVILFGYVNIAYVKPVITHPLIQLFTCWQSMNQVVLVAALSSVFYMLIWCWIQEKYGEQRRQAPIQS